MITNVYLGNRLVATCPTEDEALSLCRIYSAGSTGCIWTASNERHSVSFRDGVDLCGEQLSLELAF